MASVWVCFSPGFLSEQDFPQSYLITADHVGKTLRKENSAGAVLSRLQTPLEQPHFTSEEIVLWRAAPTPSTTQYTGAIPSTENPPPERKPGPKCTWMNAIFKKFIVNRRFKF
jgi:hypothetical protein